MRNLPIGEDSDEAVFAGGVEAGAGFGGKVAVTADCGAGMRQMEGCEQAQQRDALGRGACVGRTSRAVEAADVAHAYRSEVVPAAVCAGQFKLAPGLYGAVETHHKVVTDVGEPALPVPAAYVGGAVVASGRSGGAMDDDGVDCAVAAHAGSCSRSGVFSHSYKGFAVCAAKLRSRMTETYAKMLHRPAGKGSGYPGRSHGVVTRWK